MVEDYLMLVNLIFIRPIANWIERKWKIYCEHEQLKFNFMTDIYYDRFVTVI